MSEIKVTAAELKSKKEELASLNKSYKSQLEQLKTTMTQLDAMWDGDAQDAFKATFNKDQANLMQYYTLINKYCKALDQIIAAYTKAERTNVNIAKTRSAK